MCWAARQLWLQAKCVWSRFLFLFEKPMLFIVEFVRNSDRWNSQMLGSLWLWTSTSLSCRSRIAYLCLGLWPIAMMKSSDKVFVCRRSAMGRPQALWRLRQSQLLDWLACYPSLWAMYDFLWQFDNVGFAFCVFCHHCLARIHFHFCSCGEEFHAVLKCCADGIFYLTII